MNAKLAPQKVTVSINEVGLVVEFGVFVKREDRTDCVAGGITRCGSPPVLEAVKKLLDALQVELNVMAGDETAEEEEQPSDDMDL